MSADRLAQALGSLAATIEARRGVAADISYTAQLLADPSRAAKKLGEEAVEMVIAAVEADRPALAAEAADVLYHWLALLAACDIPLDEVAERLEARAGRSGLDEKASRSR